MWRVLAMGLALTGRLALAGAADGEIAQGRARLEIGAWGSPPAALTDLKGDARRLEGEIQSSFPLAESPAKNLLKGESVYRLLGSARVALANVDVSSLASTRHILESRVGLTGVALTPGRNIYLLAVGTSIAQETSTLSALFPRIEALAIGSARLGDDFLLLFGLNYSLLTGRQYPLPLLGFDWELGESWRMRLLIPALFELRWMLAESWELRLLAALQGGRSRIANAGDFPGEPAFVDLQAREGRAGLGVAWRAANSFWLRAEAGALVARRLAFLDNGAFRESGVEPTGYLRLALDFRLGSSLLDETLPSRKQ